MARGRGRARMEIPAGPPLASWWRAVSLMSSIVCCLRRSRRVIISRIRQKLAWSFFQIAVNGAAAVRRARRAVDVQDPHRLRLKLDHRPARIERAGTGQIRDGLRRGAGNLGRAAPRLTTALGGRPPPRPGAW